MGSKFAFWGVQLKPNKEAPMELQEFEVLRISTVTLGEKISDPNGRSVVSVKVGDDDKKYALCVLIAGKTESFSLDFTIQGEEKIVLEVSGKNSVNLIGNFGLDYDSDESSLDDEDGALIDMYDDDNSLTGEDEEAASEDEPKLIKDVDPPIITELPDESKPLVPATPGKKGKGNAVATSPAKHQKPSNLAGNGPGGKEKAGKGVTARKNVTKADVNDDEDDDDDDDDVVGEGANGNSGHMDIGDDDGEDEEDEIKEKKGGHVKKQGSEIPSHLGQKKRGPLASAGHTPAAKKQKSGALNDGQANGAAPKSILKASSDAKLTPAKQKGGASSIGGGAGPSTPASKDQSKEDATDGTPNSKGSAKKKRNRRKSKGGAGSSS